MQQIHSPDFVGKSDNAVVMLVSSLDNELDGVLERFHNDEEVSYRFEWYWDQDENGNYLVVFYLEFDSGEKVRVGLVPYHWDCLPAVLSLGYLVLMTDERLLGDKDGEAASDAGEPRALLIHNAFMGLDKLVGEANRKVQEGEAEDLKLILKLFEMPRDSEGKQTH